MTSSEEKDSKTNGRWTKPEHEKFLLGLELYGKNWKKIEELLVTRTGSQIRSHAQKYFLKSKRPNDEVESLDGGHESGEKACPVTVISNLSSEFEIKATSNHHEMNFWDQFIDMKRQKEEESFEEIPRKSSLTMNDCCNDSKIDTSFPCVSILSEPVN